MHQKLLVPGSLVVHPDHHPPAINESQFTTNVDEEIASQIILPSTLVESKASGLRNRDGSKLAV